MPVVIVNTDFKENGSLWAPSNIQVFLLVSVIKMKIDNQKDRKILLYIDGVEAAAFEADGKAEIPITQGAHTIQAKYKNLSTLAYSFNISGNEHAKKIFCVGNANFRQRMKIATTIFFLYLFLFVFMISFFPKINMGLLFLPIIGMLVYYIIALKRHSIIDITEMWSEYI